MLDLSALNVNWRKLDYSIRQFIAVDRTGWKVVCENRSAVINRMRKTVGRSATRDIVRKALNDDLPNFGGHLLIDPCIRYNFRKMFCG